jgi:hypothetical protein
LAHFVVANQEARALKDENASEVAEEGKKGYYDTE